MTTNQPLPDLEYFCYVDSNTEFEGYKCNSVKIREQVLADRLDEINELLAKSENTLDYLEKTEYYNQATDKLEHLSNVLRGQK